MPKLAVLGHPVSHSRSPAMHNAALRELGLSPEWTYGAIDVPSEDFARLVRSLPDRGFAGANVTVPHKVAALALADDASAAARAIGAANTLSFNEGRVAAENTDASAIIAALPGPVEGKRALVLGAGGSARAAAWAFREGGGDVHIWNRTQAKAERLAEELGVLALPPRRVTTGEYDLIVNATTVGMSEASDESGGAGLEDLPIEPAALHRDQTVVDLVYGARETPLVTAARRADVPYVDGLEILARQGAASLRLWTGREPPLEVMRSAARDAAD